MGKRLLEEGPVRAVQPGQQNVGIVDAKLAALADQALGEREQRALAQVVGAPP